MASARTGAQRAVRRAPSRVRWDRLGRVAMLFVLLVLVALFISPARALISTLSQSSHRRGELAVLLHENAQLKARAAALQQPGTLEADARELGLVKPGERPYVITGLPAN